MTHGLRRRHYPMHAWHTRGPKSASKQQCHATRVWTLYPACHANRKIVEHVKRKMVEHVKRLYTHMQVSRRSHARRCCAHSFQMSLIQLCKEIRVEQGCTMSILAAGAHACRCSDRWSVRPPCPSTSPPARVPTAAAPLAVALPVPPPVSPPSIPAPWLPATPAPDPPPGCSSLPPTVLSPRVPPLAPAIPSLADTLPPSVTPGAPSGGREATLAGPLKAASKSGKAAAESASDAFRSQPQARAARRKSSTCCRSRAFSPCGHFACVTWRLERRFMSELRQTQRAQWQLCV